MPTLLLSQRHTPDNQLLWRAAIKKGWSIERINNLKVPAICSDEIILYVEALYAPFIAKQLNLSLIDPPTDWLLTVPFDYRQRNVKLTTLGQAASEIITPQFVKPPNDKSFAAKVYESGKQLPVEFDEKMEVLVIDPVTWKNEYRCFILDREVVTASPYVLNDEHAEMLGYVAPEDEFQAAIQFAQTVANDHRVNMPRAIVLDIGLLANNSWAVIEANGAWGSGIYNCDPNLVLEVIRHATIQLK